MDIRWQLHYIWIQKQQQKSEYENKNNCALDFICSNFLLKSPASRYSFSLNRIPYALRKVQDLANILVRIQRYVQHYLAESKKKMCFVCFVCMEYRFYLANWVWRRNITELIYPKQRILEIFYYNRIFYYCDANFYAWFCVAYLFLPSFLFLFYLRLLLIFAIWI